MRFALKSRRGPHFPIASDAPKSMRKEIERRMDIVKDIKYEPRLTNGEISEKEQIYPHFYRMKAVDALKDIEEAIVNTTGDETKHRPSGQDVKFYLTRLSRPGNPLESIDLRTIEAFVDSYTHARHEPLPVFGLSEYNKHMELVNEIIEGIGQPATGKTALKQESTTQKRPPKATTPPSGAKSTSISINGRSSRGEAIMSETSV